MSPIRLRLLRVLASVVATVLVTVAPAAERPRAGADPEGVRVAPRKFGEIIGLQVKYSQGEPQRELATLKELGVRWVRDFVHWRALEPSPGEYRDFPDGFKSRLAFYRENGIAVVLLLGFENGIAYPATAEMPYRAIDPEAFGRYAAYTAKLMRASGVRFVLEVWNEPHNTLRPLLGGSWNGKPPAPWLDHYLRMVHEAVKQVKALDPAIKVLTDDDMWVIHYWFLEAGLPRTLDGFAFHPYGASAPELTAVERHTDWVKPFVVVDEDRSFRSAVRLLRERGRVKLGRTPEMWITEWGWAIGEKIRGGAVTEDVLVGFLPRAFITAAAAGVEVVCWFSSQDRDDGPMGLSANDGRRRKSYYAFKTMSEQLAEYTLVRQLEGAERPAAGVQAFLFRGASDYKVVIWNIDGAQRSLSLRGALSKAKAVDALGQPVVATDVPTAASSLPFASAPIYVSGLTADLGGKLEIK